MLRCEFFRKLQETEEGRKYLQIVSEPILETGELHHIYPKSFEEGAINTEDNLVRLSVENHLLAHYYLAKSIPCQQTYYAFRMMWDLHSKNISQPVLEMLQEVAELRRKGRVKSEEIREKQRQRIQGRVIISKAGKEKKIYPDQLGEYLENGWVRGRAKKPYNPSEGKIWVHNKNEDLRILPEELESYLRKGYQTGRVASSTKGKIRMSRGDEIRYATPETVENFQNQGFQKGVKIARTRVEKDGRWKYVRVEDLRNMKQQGWKQNHSFL